MNYKQIGEILNDVYGSIIGEGELIKEDLSNIVEVGKVITASSTFDDNFDNLVKKLVDKVGKTIEHTDTLEVRHLPIYRDSWEYGSILEKIRVEAPETEEDYTFDLSNYTGEDVFTLAPAEISAKYFNNSTTFKIKISLPKKQLKSAFTSASQMNKVISAIENRIMFKLDIDLLALEYRNECNLIAEKFKNGNKNCLINLYEEYVNETGDTTVEVDKFLTTDRCLRFANKKIKMLRSFLKKASVLYNDGGYTNVTNSNQQITLLLTDFVSSLDSYLYSSNRHNEYLKIDNFTEMPYWQSGGKDDSYSNRSSINVIPASEGKAPTTGDDTRLVINETNILGVIQDIRACAVTCEHAETESINVPDARFINFWHFRDANYINDVDENVIVLYLSEYALVGKLASIPADFTGNYYTKADGEYTVAQTFSTSDVYYKEVIPTIP